MPAALTSGRWYVETILSFDFLPLPILETEVIHGGDDPSSQASQVSTSRPRLGQSSNPNNGVRRDAPSPRPRCHWPTRALPCKGLGAAAGFIPTMLDRLESQRFGNPRPFILYRSPFARGKNEAHTDHGGQRREKIYD